MQNRLQGRRIFISMFIISAIAFLLCINISTENQIEASYKRSIQAPLFDILDQAFQRDAIEFNPHPIPEKFWPLLGLENQEHLNIVYQNNEAVALIIPATSQNGYSGEIKIIIAVSRDGHIIGVRILKHSETRGLGDKIDISTDDWILAFDGKSLSNTSQKSWAVRKDGGDFDQISGATITSKSVISKVFDSLRYFEQDKIRLFGQTISETASL